MKKNICMIFLTMILSVLFGISVYAQSEVVSYGNDDDLTAIAYNGTVCVVINDEQILTSDDFENWQCTKYSAQNCRFRILFYLDGKFWLVQEKNKAKGVYAKDLSEDSKIFFSEDGYNWYEYSSQFETNPKYIKLSNDRQRAYLYFSDENIIATSDMNTFSSVSIKEFQDALQFEYTKETEFEGITLRCAGLNVVYTSDGSSTRYTIPQYPDSEIQCPFARNTAGTIVSMGGEKFVTHRYLNILTNAAIVPYNETAYNFFAEEKQMGEPLDYIFTNNGYMAHVPDVESENRMDIANTFNKVYFYDKNCSLITEQQFDGCVKDIVYDGGIYYVHIVKYGERYSSDDGKIISESWQQSQNMYDWEIGEEPEEYPKRERSYRSDEGNMIYVSKSGNEYPIKYENEALQTTDDVCGWRCRVTDDEFDFSAGGVYFARVNMPENFNMVNDGYMQRQQDYMWRDTSENVLFSETDYGVIVYTPLAAVKLSQDEISGMANENTPYVVMDGNVLAFEQPPVIENDRTLIPIRFLFEQMGANVTWNQETQAATVTQNDTAVTFRINDTEADVNGQTVSMDVPARLINDKTMVPVRFLSEQLGYNVSWDGENRIITIE